MLTLPLCCIYKFFTKEVGALEHHPGKLNPSHIPTVSSTMTGLPIAHPRLTLRYAQIGSDGSKPENRDILSGFSESRLSPRETACEAMAGTHWQPIHFS